MNTTMIIRLARRLRKTVLRQGDSGGNVKVLQEILSALGAGLGHDGKFGALTAVAVTDLQRDVLNLTADAVVGPNTIAGIFGVTGGGFIGDPALPLRDPVDRLTVLDVPYLQQRDNRQRPGGTCNVTCVAMLAGAAGEDVGDVDGEQLEDRLYGELRTPDGQRAVTRLARWSVTNGIAPETVHAMLSWLLRRHGYPRARFLQGMGRARLIEIVRGTVRTRGQPVIVSGAFTRSGHLVVVRGATAAGDLLVNDPWGDWTRRYEGDAGRRGRAVLYPADAAWAALDRGGEGAWVHVAGVAAKPELHEKPNA